MSFPLLRSCHSCVVYPSAQSDTSGFTKKGFSVTTPAPAPAPTPEPPLESKPSVAVAPEAVAAATTAATVVDKEVPSATESKLVTESEESVTVKEPESIEAVTESVEPAESVTESVESVVVVTEEDLELEQKKSQIRSEALSGVVEEVEAASDEPKGMDNGMLQVFLSLALPPHPKTNIYICT